MKTVSRLRSSDGSHLQTVLTNIDRYFKTDDDLLPDLLISPTNNLLGKQDDANRNDIPSAPDDGRDKCWSD